VGVLENFSQHSGVAIDSDLTMQRSNSDASHYNVSPLAKLRFWQSRRASAGFSLKQRMENVLRDDRRSIQDPLTYLQATILAE
jgi:hypothetical protein